MGYLPHISHKISIWEKSGFQPEKLAESYKIIKMCNIQKNIFAQRPVGKKYLNGPITKKNIKI